MSATSAQPTILLIEDDFDILDAVSDALAEEGYRVRTAVNGREALALLPALARPYVVLLDLTMPVMNGEEFLRAARQAGLLQGIPVLVITASLVSELPAGASGLLKKPFRRKDLFAALLHVCRAE
jgi:two-component system phosphate regulon response regulator PhoB